MAGCGVGASGWGGWRVSGGCVHGHRCMHEHGRRTRGTPSFAPCPCPLPPPAVPPPSPPSSPSCPSPHQQVVQQGSPGGQLDLDELPILEGLKSGVGQRGRRNRFRCSRDNRWAGQQQGVKASAGAPARPPPGPPGRRAGGPRPGGGVGACCSTHVAAIGSAWQELGSSAARRSAAQHSAAQPPHL